MANAFIQYKVRGIQPLLNMTAPGVVTSAVEQAMSDVAPEIVQRVKSLTPFDSGSNGTHIRDTITAQLVDVGHLSPILHIFSTLEETDPGRLNAIEFGAEPHWPPEGAVQDWSSRHGLQEGQTLNSVRFFLSQKATPASLMFTQTLATSGLQRKIAAKADATLQSIYRGGGKLTGIRLIKTAVQL